MVPDATGMGWTSGTGTFPPCRVGQGVGMCPGFGGDTSLCSLGRGMELPTGSYLAVE